MAAAAPEVQENIDAINARIGQFEETAVQYYSALMQTMEHHNHLIQLVKTYNNKATDFMFAAADLEEELQQPTLYQSVAEVQAAIDQLNSALRQVRDAHRPPPRPTCALAKDRHAPRTVVAVVSVSQRASPLCGAGCLACDWQ